MIYEQVCQYKYGLENKIFGNVIESIMFQDYNQIIDEIMNNIVVEEQNKNINNNTFNLFENKNSIDKNILNLDNEGIPSKSINGKQIKLNKNIFENETVFSNNNIFNNYDLNKDKKNECNLCKQINKLDVDNKKYLIEYLNKLNELIFKNYNE